MGNKKIKTQYNGGVLRVLIADHEMEYALMMKRSISNSNFGNTSCTIVNSSKKAIQYARLEDFHCIFIPCMFSAGIDGFITSQVIRKKQIKDHRDLSFICLVEKTLFQKETLNPNQINCTNKIACECVDKTVQRPLNDHRTHEVLRDVIKSGITYKNEAPVFNVSKIANKSFNGAHDEAYNAVCIFLSTLKVQLNVLGDDYQQRDSMYHKQNAMGTVAAITTSAKHLCLDQLAILGEKVVNNYLKNNDIPSTHFSNFYDAVHHYYADIDINRTA